jgi:hypothetical protein
MDSSRRTSGSVPVQPIGLSAFGARHPARVTRVLAGFLGVLTWGLPPCPTLHGAEPNETPAWTTGPGYRSRPLQPAGGGSAGFEAVPASHTGVIFTNELPELQGLTNRVLFNGSGVALGDYDGDGRPDVFLPRLNGTNALYRNLGNWRFQEVTAEAGLAHRGRLDRGAVFADLSGDGRLDLLVSTTGDGVRFYLNGGTNQFRDFSQRVGTRNPYGAMSLAVADVDGDRFLDLYVANYRTDDIKDQSVTLELDVRDGQPVVPPAWADRLVVEQGQLLQYGEPDVLFRNDRHGKLVPVPWEGGRFLDETGKPLRRPPLDWGLSATFRDLNDDGFPDLYVCNDFWTPDRIWLGDGQGTFRAMPPFALRSISGSSMGVEVGDLDRDGHVDMLVLEMLSRDLARRKREVVPHASTPALPPGEGRDRPQVDRNTLFRGRGDGTFAEVARFAGLDATGWSWSPVLLDVDLDGYEDVLVTAGHVRDILDADSVERVRTDARATRAGNDPAGALARRLDRDRWFPPLVEPLLAYRNLGGMRFAEATKDWSPGEPGIHHALATADFDDDGDLDLVMTQLNGPTRLYRNRGAAPRVAVRLAGRRPNVQGIGAQVVLRDGAVPRQSTEVVAGGRYLAGSDPLVVFAAGRATRGMTLEVLWPSGQKTAVLDVEAGRLYEIQEPLPPGLTRTERPLAPKPAPLFRDVSDRLGHSHHEERFNDFERQPLLPRHLSQWGPGIAWHDLDGDGWDDLAIGSGKGGTPAWFRNDQKGGFLPGPNPGPALAHDLAGVVGWHPSPKSPVWLMAEDHYEDATPSPSRLLRWSSGSAPVAEPGCELTAATGPLALGDFDGDGTLELFVGGRVTPGRYPEPTDSALFRWREGQWRRIPTPALQGVGLVNGAVWTDLDGDGFPELALACEWGPIRLFRHDQGRLTEITEAWGLTDWTGLWSGITSGDFDGDGRMDLAVGNRGSNTDDRATPDRPLELWYGSFSGLAGLDLIETEWDPVRAAVVPRLRLNELQGALPWLPERFATHRAYSEASLETVLGQHQAQAHRRVVRHLETTVFLQREGRFVPTRLPLEAQLAPVFGINVADADGDGNTDLFLAQNCFAQRPDRSRDDAGTGLWLLGDGRGSFRALSPQAAGFALPGEQRGSAVADFNGDGRMDLVVTQNGAATRLLENVGARPGLRVRLLGPPGNPTGVGATVRLFWEQRGGAIHEVHAGSGYGSQDSAVLILGVPTPPTSIQVRWPGGRVTDQAVPPGATQLDLR